MPYTCDDIAALEILLDSKQDQLAVYQLELADLQADLADLQQDLTDAQSLLDTYEGNLEKQEAYLADKLLEKQAAEGELTSLQTAIAFLRLKFLNLQNERAELQTYVDGQPEVVTAWCADYTLNLTGEVGIADVPGASGLDFQGVTYFSPAVVRQIRPGFSGRASYNSARDGILQHAKASAPANHFLQACFHSAVMKWKPQYRHGLLTAINYDNDTCSVALEPAYDKYMFNGFNVNQVTELSGIPIEYMDCNSAVFVIGDDVIIEWISAVPKVVGYKQFPRPCEFDCTPELCGAFAWDYENNPTTANRYSVIDISVLNGCPPYTWSIETTGGGWSLGTPQTWLPVNTLTVGCGTCEISVSCECGVLSGYDLSVRSTAGAWTGPYAGCVLSGQAQGTGCSHWIGTPSAALMTAIIGKYYQVQGYYTVYDDAVEMPCISDTNNVNDASVRPGEDYIEFPFSFNPEADTEHIGEIEDGGGLYRWNGVFWEIAHTGDYWKAGGYWSPDDPDACYSCMSGFGVCEPFFDAGTVILNSSGQRIEREGLCGCGDGYFYDRHIHFCVKMLTGPAYYIWEESETC